MSDFQKRILIVDDDDEIRELLEFDVAQSGYFVDVSNFIFIENYNNLCYN